MPNLLDRDAVRVATAPTLPTVKRLFAVSGNRCAFPGCPTFAHDGNSVLVQICHIEGDRPDSARYRREQPDAERHGFSNLVLLCGTHHKIVDDDDETYSVERLQKIKANAESAQPEPASEENDRISKALLQQISEHLQELREDALLPTAVKNADGLDIEALVNRISDLGIGVFIVLHDQSSKVLTLWVDVPSTTMADLKFQWASIATISSDAPNTEHLDIGACDLSDLRGTNGRGQIGTMRIRIPIANARELAAKRRMFSEFWLNVSAYIVDPNNDNTGFQKWIRVPFTNLEVPLASSW